MMINKNRCATDWLVLTLSFLMCLFILAETALANSDNSNQPDKLLVLDISERAYDGGNALSVTFNQAINGNQNIDDYLKVSVDKGGSADGSWELSKNLSVAYFGHAEPNTRYTVNVYSGLRTVSGLELRQHYQEKIKTRNIAASVSFPSNGNFLSLDLSDGLPVTAVNVPEVNIDFFRVKEKRVSRFLEYMANYANSNWSGWRVDEAVTNGELVYSGRFDLEFKANKRRISHIPVGDIAPLGKPGVYLAVMFRPGQYSNYKRVSYFTVTDIGLHARIYNNQLDIHVSSIASGEPLNRVELSLIDKNGKAIESRESTPEGSVSFINPPQAARHVIARTNDQFTFLSLQGPAMDLSEFDIGKRNQRREEIFIYAPRDLYRPGEVVEFSALRRDADGRLSRGIPLSAKILRPDRVVAHNFTWHEESLGYYGYRFQLPDSAKPGNWKLQLSGVDKTPVEYDFKVEEFMPERMEFEFNQDESAPIIADDRQVIKIPVTGRYLYGAPADGNRLSTLVRTRKAVDIIPSLKGYQFGHDDGKNTTKSFSAEDIKLDKNGEGVIVLDPVWQSTKAALEVKLISSLYESGGRPINRVYNAYVWPEKAMLGIKPGFGDDNPDPNSLVEFDLVKATIDGSLQKADSLDVILIREDRQYFWEFNNDQGWRWQWTDSEYPVYSQNISLDGAAPGKLKIPVEYGYYRLEVRDVSNNNQVSSARFHAGEDWYYWWRRNNDSNRAAPRPDQVTLALNAESYKAGDIALLRVVSPHDGQAIITVESDRPLWFTRTQVLAAGSTIEIPIDQDWNTHDLYISAVVFKAGESTNTVTPNRAIGLVHLPLDRSDRELSVEIDAPEKIRPDQTQNVGVRVTSSGDDLPRYVTLAAVDVGVLAISRFETPNPFDGFFGQRRYSVDQRDMYHKIIELQKSEKARLRFGGDAALARGGEAAKADVQIVSLFSGLVELDNNGSASIPMKIPDFNGRLRFMVLAFGEESFGSLEQDVTVASPVVAQLSMPRFMAMGDTSSLALDVTNLSGKARNLEIKLDASDPLQIESQRSFNILLDNEERRTLRYDVSAEDEAGTGIINIKIGNDEIGDIHQDWKLQVRSAYPSVTRTVGSVLNAGDSININDAANLKDYLPNSLQGLVSVSTEANMRLREQLRYLIRYPYGCLEQTTSSAYPLAYATMENLSKVGISQYSRDDIQKRIDKGMSRLISLQKSNGSFGLWDANSPEEQWLTAYTVDFLLVARSNGYKISDSMLDRALSRLETYTRRRGAFTRQRYSDDNNHYAFASKAYAAYLLSGLNRVPLGTLRTLFDKEAEFAKGPVPLLHIGLALSRQGDSKRAKQAIKMMMAMSTEKRRSYLGDYGSNIRDLAVMVHLLIKHGVHADAARKYAFDLANALRSRRWLSTQERNSLFLAGLSLQTLPTKEWQVEVETGEETLIYNGEGSASHLLSAQQIGRKFVLEARKGESLYASLSVSGYLKKAPAPESNGLRIERRYFDTKGNALDLNQVKTGDLILVDLTLSADQRTPDALVVDLLPAGFELENQNLETAVSLKDFRIDGQTIESLQSRLQLKYQEFRDDRYVAAVDLPGYGGAHLVYLVRAVTPGKYAVPAPFIEDMYRPEIRAIGTTIGSLSVGSEN